MCITSKQRKDEFHAETDTLFFVDIPCFHFSILLTFWVYDYLSNHGYPNRMIIAAGGKNYDISNLSSSMDKDNKDRYRIILTFGEDDMPLLDAITSGENITIRIYGQSGEYWQREVNANEDSMVSTKKLYQAYRKALDTVGAKPAQGTFLKMSIR